MQTRTIHAIVRCNNSTRLFSNVKKLLGRYNTTPVELFRMGQGIVRLREESAQRAKNLRSYDFTLRADGLMHPALGDNFIGPNGMSLRPHGSNMWGILSSYAGRPVVTRIPAGTKLPSNIVLLHERGDHYSLQTTEPVTPSEFNKRLNTFLKDFESFPKETYFDRYPLK